MKKLWWILLFVSGIAYVVGLSLGRLHLTVKALGIFILTLLKLLNYE